MNTFVVPRNRCGSIEHYFHFLFGYLIPFVNNVSPSDETYAFADCGPLMNEILADIVGFKTTTQIGIDSCDKKICFQGHDDVCFTKFDIQLTRMKFFDVFQPRTFDKKVLVVDRAKPHVFYETRAEIKESGSCRRSVPNMTDVFSEIKQVFKNADLVFLEGMPLKDQMELFSNSSCVVMQHGAAMANLIWCEKGASVVEIRSDLTVDYFKKMVGMAGLNHVRIKQDHDHACVSPKEVLKGLLNCFSKIM